MIREQFGMEYMDEIGKYIIGLHRHTFLERTCTHVAVHDSMITEGLEITITRFLIK